MKKFNELIDQSGFLTEKGKDSINLLMNGLEKTFQEFDIKNMSCEDIRVFGGVVSNIINKVLSEKIQGKLEITKKFDEMTDKQFIAYLKVKYGHNLLYHSLCNEEFNRIKNTSEYSEES